MDAFQFPGEKMAKEVNPQFAAFPLELKRTLFNVPGGWKWEIMLK
jgi:hypothetical protein